MLCIGNRLPRTFFGMLQANCEKTSYFQPEAFPRDHLRDVFSGWGSIDGRSLERDFVKAGALVTVIV
jgi:hypothetical protein